MDNCFDSMFYPEGDFIGGIDEAGVSDIAGPLIAACVILPKIDLHRDDLRIFEVNDSKKIPERYRKQHAEVIYKVALAIGIGEVLPVEIDYLGRWYSIRLAMMRSIAACKKKATKKPLPPDFILVDGTMALPTNIPHQAIAYADTKSLCVAAASIVAKVYRDEIMLALHQQYPFYDWEHNKGFACEKHFKGLDTHGAQPGIHRMKVWPFTDKPGDDPLIWRARRKRWRTVTKERLIPWTTENPSSTVSTE